MLTTFDKTFKWTGPKLDWPVTTQTGPGMSGVIASETEIVWVNPHDERITVRGIPLKQIAESYSFDQAAYLLILGKTPENDELTRQTFEENVLSGRRLPAGVKELIRSLPVSTHPTRLLRAGISAIGCHELHVDDDLSGEKQWTDLRILGQATGLIAEILAYRRGNPSPDPLKRLATSGYIYSALGNDPLSSECRLLDTLLILYSDHGLDAPTFTSMVVGSCLADPYYNIVVGLSALRGTNLGGAGERILNLLLSPESTEDSLMRVGDMLKQGERIPGFGHRMYSGVDPRSNYLKTTAQKTLKGSKDEPLLEKALAIEDFVLKRLAGKQVGTNINWYASLLFHHLGAEPEEVPCLYAMGRIAGMIARVKEYLQNNRLFRPESSYCGPTARSFIPVEQR